MKPSHITRPDSSEDEIHEAVAQFLDLALGSGVFWYSVENRKLGKVEGAKRKRRGVKAGIPDITIIHGRVHHAVELKTRTGSLSKAQIEARERLKNAGAIWGLARSVEDVARLLDVWRIPVRAGLGERTHGGLMK